LIIKEVILDAAQIGIGRIACLSFIKSSAFSKKIVNPPGAIIPGFYSTVIE